VQSLEGEGLQQMLEPEMDALLGRLAPGGEFEGATVEQVAALEKLAGGALPEFYRWWLSKMGTNAGPLERQCAPYYARHVINAYETGEADTEPPLLFIGRFDDPVMPMDVFYDLSRPKRNDALVVTQVGGEFTNAAETFRERLAYSIMMALRINRSPQRCRGMLVDERGDVSGLLVPILEYLGFESAVPHGQFCGIYDRTDAALVYKIEVEPDSGDVLSFSLGGADSATLRRILGEITTKSEIEVTIREWTPPLPKR
jgi:hypothetical protein